MFVLIQLGVFRFIDIQNAIEGVHQSSQDDPSFGQDLLRVSNMTLRLLDVVSLLSASHVLEY